VAAGEAADPRKTIPAAVKKIFFRIIFIYIGTILFIGAQIPYTDPSLLSSSSTTAASSPLVIAANLAGVSGVADVINAVLLLTVLSAANSNVYSGSRILVGLANDGAAPEIFKRTSKTGVPYVAVAFTAAFGLLGFLNLGGNGSTVFLWLMNITAVAGFITWSCIIASHLGFMRALAAQGISRDDLPYKTRWQTYFAWYGLFFNVIILLTQGFTVFIDFNAESFFAAYVSLLFFVVMYIGHKVITKSKFVVPSEADLRTGCVEKDETNWDDAAPKSYWAKCWDTVG
jgi:amino acid transporter